MKLKEAVRRAPWAVAVLALSCAAGLLAARVATHGMAYSDELVTGLVLGMSSLPGAVAGDPLTISWHLPAVSASFAVVAGACALATAVSAAGAFRGRYVTGEEHGAERLATEEEASSLMDHRHHYNNLLYSEHSGIVLDAYDGKTRAAQASRNMNCYTIGTSGLGKTYHLCMPDIMQSVGDALTPVRPGPVGLLEHIAGRPLLPTANRRRSKDGLGEGYDIIHTDPKGDTLRDMGNMLAAAGVEVKVINTIDFRGLRYNPLAYIPVHETDSKDAAETSCSVSVRARCHAEDGAWREESVAFEGEEALTAEHPAREAHDAESAIRASARATYETRGDARRQEGAGEAGAPASAEAVAAGFGYRRTSIDYEILVESYNPHGEADVEVKIVLDRNVIPASDEAMTIEGRYGSVEATAEDDVVTVSISGLPAFRAGEPRPVRLTLRCVIAPFRVPDGVMLTKTVNCLVANLKTDDKAQSTSDPFWEDTKRLCLMSLIAYAMEAYDDPRHWTLPVCMDLLDLATPEGNDMSRPSPLSMLMRRWEEGEYLEPERAPQGRSQRSGTRASGGRVVRAANVPHSKSSSFALHCYNAFASGAPETVQSVIVTCQAAFVNLLAPDVRDMLSADEVHLETLGDAGQKQALFIVTKDTDSPYDFLTALIIYQALDLTLDKAFKRYSGRLPRHVRLVIDEAMTIGKIPILTRAIAVVRSRNMSISMYMQSKAQAELVYGEKEASVLFDNCSTMCFLGSNTPDVLEDVSKSIGEETVYARITNRTFGSGAVPQSSSESIQSQGRAVLSVAQLRKMPNDELVVQISGLPIIRDKKFRTNRHPYYCYVSSSHPRSILMPLPRFAERFDFEEYRRRREAERMG